MMLKASLLLLSPSALAFGSFEGDDCKPTSSAQYSSDFPPMSLGAGIQGGGASDVSAAVAHWFDTTLAAIPMKPPPPMSAKEMALVSMSAAEWFSARKAGLYTCADYASALTSRAEYYRYMNQFMYWDNMPGQMDHVMAQALALDSLAEAEGVDAIAPLYCLPVPAKGTMATTDFPSSAGAGLLHDNYGTKDAGAVEQLRKMHGVVFGKTNVPEFAASWITCNWANGCTLNPYGHAFTVGGSSGGSASAVASYVAPVAFSEDTGGSTRHPAEQNQNFGYDPTRNHYPNAGNPGITYVQDQVGINTRSMDDVLAFDAAFLGLQAEHYAQALATPPIGDIRVGLPQYPFVEFFVPEGGYSTMRPTKKKVSKNVLAKYEAVAAALLAGGATMVEGEWPDSDTPGISTLAKTQFFSSIPDFDGSFEINHSFTGQMAEWIRSYLGSTVSVSDIIESSFSCGQGHNPAGLMLLSGFTDETKFRFAVGQWQYDTVAAWNSIFDTLDLDVIMTPVSFCDTVTYACQANANCTAQFDYGDGAGFNEVPTSLDDCNLSALNAWKNIPVPKISFPVGRDVSGNVVNMEFWGRSGPKGATDNTWLFDDEYAKSADVAFLHKVKTLVEAIYAADPALQRVDAPLVTGPGNLF
ncbi:amidase signature domain-containing protein [Pelagophyceae sp. CCMP2097]|nr:amidase signature domain-containing protein [Pelagophyceae sp. CCMP2097]